MAQQPPLKEGPILIEYLHQEDHHHYDRSNTSAAERRPLAPAEVWMDMALIPATPPAQTPFPGTLSAVVRGISGVALAPVPGSAIRFQPAVPGQFVDMVPANYNGGAYQPTLRDAAGAVIPYDPSVWVADGVRQLVEFKFRPPTELGYALPLNISYWRYVGTFPGAGAGGITNGLNLGTGAQVWKDLLGTVMRFRTITAGPGLSLAQDIPTADEITVSADEVTPAGAPAVPAALDLYVSAAGNDATGDGTAGNPYLTLQRAFRDIRVLGYDISATVTILAAGGTFTIPQGVLALGQGTRGRRTLPVIVKGSGRTAVNVGLAVSAVAVEPANLMQTISVAAAPANPFALGQIVRFTSGALSGQSLFLANVETPTSFVLPTTAAVAVGDTFTVETLDTVVSATGVVLVWGKGGALSLQDLRVQMAAGAVGILVFADQNTLTSGVWLENLANTGILINGAGILTAGGLQPDAAAGFVSTPLGMLVTNTNPGTTFNRLAPEETACTASFTNCVFQGNGAAGNMTINSPFLSLNQSYFRRFGTIRMLNHRADMSNLWFQDCVPNGPFFTISASGVVDVGNNAFLTLNNVSVYNSPHFGFRAFEDGCFVLGGNIRVSGCTDAGLYSDRGGHVVLTAAAASISWGAGNAGPGVWTFDHGRFTVMGLGGLDASGASTASHGILVEKGSSLRAPNLTANTNFIHGVHIADGSHVNVSGDLVCNTNGKAGLWVECSKLVVGGALTATGNMTTGPTAPDNAGVTFTCADVGIQGNVTVTGSAFVGCLVQRSAVVIGSLAANAAVNISSSAGALNFIISGSRVDITGSLTCNSATAGGLAVLESRLTLESAVSAPAVALTCNSNGFGMTVEASVVEMSPSSTLTASNNTGNGLVIGAGSRVSLGILTVSGNSSQGLTILRADLDVAGALTANNNTAYNIGATEARLRANSVASNGSTGGFGISLTRSDADVSASLAATGNAVSNILQTASRLRVGTTVTISGTTSSPGIVQNAGSHLSASTLSAVGGATGSVVTSTDSEIVVGTLATGYPVAVGPGAGVSCVFLTNAQMSAGVFISNDLSTNPTTDCIALTKGSRCVFGATTITGHRRGVVLLNKSAMVINGVTVITVPSVVNSAAVSGEDSHFEADSSGSPGSSISGGLGDGVLMNNGSTCYLAAINIYGNGGSGVRLRRGSRAVLANILAAGGPANGAYGLAVEGNSHATFIAGTMSVTGGLGDCLVGANPVKTWLLMNAGAAVDVSDYAAAFPQMCTAVRS